MSDGKNPINEGYIPKTIEKKGYIPSPPAPQPAGDPKSQGGYIPTTSGGDNPANKPSPPGDE